ncbi:hypothetical protein XELAEV_18030270mg [Xenopus laevis]|uniref:G-protein coupled receptors family 3 profile domain-containing protein n=2 Tax=Xenopus laevis TaxID=8355 RepID=A0A974CUU3_XENLA|nr:hypothetical protein XELAEV_18030270mg [Xenopus laevis]
MNYFSDGDLIIGGILQIHELFVNLPPYIRERKYLECTFFPFKLYRHLLVLIYTIGEINKDPELLPNVTLGYQIYDSCASGIKSFASAFGILSGTEPPIPNYSCWNNRKFVGFIGDVSSESSLAIAWLSGIYRYPQISYSSGDPILNNKVAFPYVYRMIPNVFSEIDAIMSMFTFFGWNWVGLIVSDDDYGYRASKRLEKVMRKESVCLDFCVTLRYIGYLDTIKIKETIYRSTAKVILLFLSSQYAGHTKFFLDPYKLPKKIWITSSPLPQIAEMRYLPAFVTLNGTLVFSIQQGEIPGFKQFFYSLNPFKYQHDILFTNMWQLLFDCNMPTKTQVTFLYNCTGNESFDNIDLAAYETFDFRISYRIYTAVYAMAHALHELYGTMTSLPKSAESLQVYFKQWQLNALMQRLKFRTSSGDEIHFDNNGDQPARYDILKYYFLKIGNLKRIKVGSFNGSKSDGNQLFFNNSISLWEPYFSEVTTQTNYAHFKCLVWDSQDERYRKAKTEGKPSCCYTCVPCADGEMSTITDAQNCMKCSKYEKPNSGRSGCIPRNLNYLSYEDQLGATLSFISIILSFTCAVILGIFRKYCQTPIVRANNQYLSCLLLISLMLCFLSSSLFIGRPTQICCILQQVIFGIVFTISLSSLLAKTLTVIIAFSATKPGSKLKKYVGTQLSIILIIVCSLGETVISAVWLASNPPFVEADTLSDPDYIFLFCNEGSGCYFFCIIGYMGTLALLSFIVAFLAKDFPDRFNEAKNITFSMLVFCSVWVTFVPAYLSSKGSRMVAVEIFAILSSSVGLLSCIFIPKYYIIFLRPELNTKDLIVRKL